MTTIPQLATRLQEVLTQTADRAGQQTGFVQRQSRVTGSIFTQTLVFGVQAHPCPSLEQFTQITAALGVPLSPQGLDQRFSQHAAQCLEQVLTAALRVVVDTHPVAIPLLNRFTGVHIQDSTTIVLPPACADLWRGCGGSTTAGESALKLQVQWDLTCGTLQGQLQDGRESDRNSTLTTHLPPGALWIADLGYFELARLDHLGQRGIWWFSRAQATTAIQTADGRWWTVADLVQHYQQDPTLDLDVTLGKTAHLPARVLAIQVPQAVADERRRRLRTTARAHGKTVSPAHLALAGWTIFVTNLPPEHLTVTEALVLGRVRWQIELLFKRWKGQGQVDVLPPVQRWRMLCEVYARLLAQIIQHWVLVVSCWQMINRSLVKATATVRLHMLSVAKALTTPARLVEELTTIARCLASGCRMNRRNQHPNTYQLLLACDDGSLG